MQTLENYISKHPMLRQLPGANNNQYFSEALFHEVQPHIPLLIKTSSVINVSVDPSYIDIYAGDFYGFLKRYYPSVPYELYWLSCRLSGMNGPNEFDKRFLNLYLIVDSDILNKVMTAKKAIEKSAF